MEDSGGYRCELALAGDRPWVEHLVVVTKMEESFKDQTLQPWEVLEKEATTLELSEIKETLKERAEPLPPILPVFTTMPTLWSSEATTTFSIFETSSVPKVPLESQTPIPPIFLNIPGSDSEGNEYEDESESDIHEIGLVEYMDEEEDKISENTRNVSDYEDGIKSFSESQSFFPISSSSDSDIATTNETDTFEGDADEDEKEWPALPPLFTEEEEKYKKDIVQVEEVQFNEESSQRDENYMEGIINIEKEKGTYKEDIIEKEEQGEPWSVSQSSVFSATADGATSALPHYHAFEEEEDKEDDWPDFHPITAHSNVNEEEIEEQTLSSTPTLVPSSSASTSDNTSPTTLKPILLDAASINGPGDEV